MTVRYCLLIAFSLMVGLLAPPAGANHKPDAPITILAAPVMKDGIHVQPWIDYPAPLDLKKAAQTAKTHGQGLLVLFEQPGCTYCKQLHEVNFIDRPLVAFLAKHFVTVQVDIQSDKPMVTFGGKTVSQKDFASSLKAAYTPTSVFFDENGAETFRLPGYIPAPFYRAALEYVVAGGPDTGGPFRDWLDANSDRLMKKFGM